ncbi:hypothetical protein KSS87_009527, partial [Heliosperma pusillum]
EIERNRKMDALRKQLDVLMGANRNGDVTEINRKYEEAKAKAVDNYDRDLEDVIDRLIVECDRKITRALKRLSEEDAKAAIAISVSEVTLTEEISELSKQIKEKLQQADLLDLEGKTDTKIRVMEEIEELRTKRADKQSMLLLDAFNKDRASLIQSLPNPPLVPLPVVAPDARTQELINEKLKKAEDLGEQGMVDEAQKVMEEAEALKRLAPRPEPVGDPTKYTAADVRITDQKLRVCDICGAFLSVYDSDRRLADHFGGKLHLGYMQIREKLAELQEEKNKKRKLIDDDRRSRERSRDLERASSRDRNRGDSRERRDYDRKSRDHGRNNDGDRGYDRDRERDREHSRSYDARSRRRSRSRSRDRSRDHGRDYDRSSEVAFHDCNAIVGLACIPPHSAFF